MHISLLICLSLTLCVSILNAMNMRNITSHPEYNPSLPHRTILFILVNLASEERRKSKKKAHLAGPGKLYAPLPTPKKEKGRTETATKKKHGT